MRVPVTSIRRGTRTFIRERFDCGPDGCGAKAGQPCVAYVPKPGKTTGKPTGNVHAARWAAYHTWAWSMNDITKEGQVNGHG
jgi:hypothetical protein